MERLWRQLQRPLLAEVVAAYDRGIPVVDPFAYAAELGQRPDRIRAALTALQVAGFLETQPHRGDLLITRVCPLARQVLAGDPARNGPIPPDASTADGASPDG
ncbi:hypothetical protein ACFQY4_19475 [Catellatospora bangladeshensis]|uniref:hypothetical protein n=1 Tax=Catellatospora bangladeshensis TaxID=310355 RepID=UPI001942A886|nr:hypothetical protein [Catellatospora bangladeshensis]